MKSILLLGLGKSSFFFVDYFQRLDEVHLTVVSKEKAQPEMNAILQNKNITFFQLDLLKERPRLLTFIEQSDAVVSLLPSMPFINDVAQICLEKQKHFLNASYTLKTIKDLDEQVKQKGLLFLSEVGLDPGIDHMSIQKKVDEVHAQGGKFHKLISYTGGLVAPESDNNPLRYKYTWNPRNVIIAGQGTNVYLENGREVIKPYWRLFDEVEKVNIKGLNGLVGYPNRNSLTYKKLYHLPEVNTLIRGTLRYQIFCQVWHQLIRLGITDNNYTFKHLETVTHSEFTARFLSQKDKKLSIQERVAQFLGLPRENEVIETLAYLGLFEDTLLNLSSGTAAEVLQSMLTDRLQLGAEDKDMVVMHHRFEYTIDGQTFKETSFMQLEGLDKMRTAMAKTVGLPLAIATDLVLQGQCSTRGCVIPNASDIYLPVLKNLEKWGVAFEESEG